MIIEGELNKVKEYYEKLLIQKDNEIKEKNQKHQQSIEQLEKSNKIN